MLSSCYLFCLLKISNQQKGISVMFFTPIAVIANLLLKNLQGFNFF